MTETRAREAVALPVVSVIVPCRDDGATLGLVLAALAGQDYPREQLEVIVVDNGSRDDSRAVAAAHAVMLLEEPRPSAYRARNRGIAVARGAYLLFLDADTVPCPGWVSGLVATARGRGAPLVGGRIENAIRRPSLGSLLAALTHASDMRRVAVERDGRLSGGNMLVARELFERYGPFREVESGGDGEFSERANPDRLPIPYCSEAVVMHLCDWGVRDYWRRAYRVGRGQAQTSLKARGVPVPWRPGWRRALGLRAALRQLAAETAGSAGWPRAGVLRILAVLWIERIYFYLGHRQGRREREARCRT